MGQGINAAKVLFPSFDSAMIPPQSIFAVR
jgi:hypothetical protein